jgi:hypothetical protein
MALRTAAQTGCPRVILNLVFSLYGGPRRLLVHGAVSNPCGGNTGLIAGCGYAVHLLRAYLALCNPQGTSIRIYVDDITLSAVAPTAREVVRRLGRGVPQVKRQLAEKAMITGDSKEQFFSHPGCAQHLA